MLIYASANDGRCSELGPAASFRAIGGRICNDFDGREIVAMCDGVWRRPKAPAGFQLLWIENEILLRFEDSARGIEICRGPFEMVGLVCGTLHVNREHSRPIARLDAESGQWRLLDDDSLWPEIGLLPAPGIEVAAGLLAQKQPQG